MTETKTTEFSAELQALLVANEIPIAPIDWQASAEEVTEIREAHREACSKIFSQIQRVESPSYSMRVTAEGEQEMKGNPENIAKLRDLLAELEAQDAKLQAALAAGVFKKAAEAESAAWNRSDKMNKLYWSLKKRHDRLQYVASHRFTQALKQLRERGFVAKQSGKVTNLIDGVPAVWPQGSKADWAWDFWHRGTHDTEGNLTPAGKALETAFNEWGIVFEFTENGRKAPVLRINLNASDSLPQPSLELINELGAALGREEVEV